MSSTTTMRVMIWILPTVFTGFTVHFSMDPTPTTVGIGMTGTGMTGTGTAGTMIAGILPIPTGAWVTHPGTAGCTEECMEAGIPLTAIMAGEADGDIPIPAGIPVIMEAGVIIMEAVTITGMENVAITIPLSVAEVEVNMAPSGGQPTPMILLP